jgi:hypothetical protein
MLLEEAPQQSVKDSTGAGRQGGIPENQFHHTAGTVAQFLAEAELCREDVVAELILMVSPLYCIMSVAMLNYKWCLALRSVLGTSGVWHK